MGNRRILAFMLGDSLECRAWRGMVELNQARSSLNGLERGIHVKIHTLGGHGRCAGACSRDDGIFVAYKRLRM